MKSDSWISCKGDCLAFLTGASASNAKEETQYYGEKYFATKEYHSWDSGSITTTSTHLTEGTCTYVCNNCGGKKYETISKTTTHEFGNWIYVDTTNHKRECPCGEVETDIHIWSVATCTAKSKCGTCNSERGEVDTNNHSVNNVWISANGQHYHACTNGCDAKLDIANCTDTDHNHKCDVCSADMGTHEAAPGKHTCDYCGQTVTECADTDHNHKCDACSADRGTHEAAPGKHTCDYCGQTVTECKDDDKNHKCDTCGATVSVSAVGEPDEDVNSDGDGLSGGAIAGIAVGSTAVVGIGSFSLIWFVIKKKSWADFLAIFKNNHRY